MDKAAAFVGNALASTSEPLERMIRPVVASTAGAFPVAAAGTIVFVLGVAITLAWLLALLR